VTTATTSRPFTARFTVRTYELDRNGHLNGSVYVQWADHARWECACAAGVSVDDLIGSGVGPVNLETTVRFHRELRAGAEVEVSCAFEWSDGKTMRVLQEFRTTDGTLVAELVSVGGLLDLRERRLVSDPRECWRGLARDPGLLGL
jgi:acyl-CoA thioester hydrolase